MRFFNTQGVYYQYNVKRKLPWVKIVEIMVTILLLMALLGAVFQLVFTKLDESKYKPKGKMVDAGGYRLFTNATGDGTVTVVCESDIGTPFQQWNKIKEPISKSARVFTYERAGYGQSDRGTAPRDIEKAAKDLRAALRKTTSKAPFILVGHGYGGLIMLKFAELYPDEVAALVLIDSFTEEIIKSEEFKIKLKKELTEARLLKYGTFLGIPRAAEQFNMLKMNESLLKGLNQESADIYKANKLTLKYNRTVNDEMEILNDYDGSIKMEGLLGDKPVIVFNSEAVKMNEEMQKALLQLSTKSELITVEGSSTYIHMDKAEEVLRVLNTLIKKVGK